MQTEKKVVQSTRKFMMLVVFAMSTTLGFGQTFGVLTYNIRLDTEQDGENRWDYRKVSMVELVNRYRPAILGVQEALYHLVCYLDSSLVNYTYIGVGRDDGKKAGEYSAIFFDSTLLRVITHSTFWLSEHPDSVSLGWDAVCKRVCTYGLFEYKLTHAKFWVFNTHFDHVGEVARKKSAELIINRIKELNDGDFPVIAMGDFNSIPESEPVKILASTLTDGSTCSQKPMTGPVGTFNGFNTDNQPADRIDYIFVSKVRVISYSHITDRRENGLYISDHLPVLAEVEI
jgi:endonuclease/exonuclease/phosphatase family metal-dependent hydrolase